VEFYRGFHLVGLGWIWDGVMMDGNVVFVLLDLGSGSGIELQYGVLVWGFL
jgi:hypothetical protein